jgi:hypothetical protein
MELLANVAQQEQQSIGYALAANRIIENRIVRRTRVNYEGKIKVFVSWLRANGYAGELTAEGKLKLPLDTNVVLTFFWIYWRWRIAPWR